MLKKQNNLDDLQFTQEYLSPLGKLLLACDNEGLTGIWFEGQKYFDKGLSVKQKALEHEILAQTKAWLDLYFKGQEPSFTPPLKLCGTFFEKLVWQELLNIPYGTVTTYGKLSLKVAKTLNKEHMAAQAVGHAVGLNPVSIIVPCHRVVGSRGNLTGYAAGLERKLKLLELEGLDTKLFSLK